MHIVKGYVGGVLAGAAMSLAAAIARGLGVPLNLELLLGSALTEQTGAATWVLGFGAHLLVSGMVGLLYALALASLRRGGPLVGMGLAVPHLLWSGVLLGWMGGAHPLMPAFLPAPGAFLSAAGSVGVLVFVLVHLLFGALVGAACAPAAESRPAPREAHA